MSLSLGQSSEVCLILCHKVCQWIVTRSWFSLGTPVSSTNKTDRRDIAEILLKMVLSTIKPNYIEMERYNVYYLIIINLSNIWIKKLTLMKVNILFEFLTNLFSFNFLLSVVGWLGKITASQNRKCWWISYMSKLFIITNLRQ